MLTIRQSRRERNPSPGPACVGPSEGSTPSPPACPSSLRPTPFPVGQRAASGSGSISHSATVAISRRFTRVLGRRRSSATTTEHGASRGPLGLHLLHFSSEPLIDLIFVHGLNGGSIKTWRKGEEPHMYWPQYWLPMDRAFYNASIHSFGYDSDWANSRQVVLNVHDFGRSLLEELATSSYLRAHDTTPIILVGHSMGGLVIKKAYILANQDRARQDLARRIRCVFFLATPHRGSDYASILNDILKVSGILSSREYITDLTSGSTSTELINESFLAYADGLQIYSFYETLKMNLGVTSVQIVDKHSAVLGFKNEHIQYLNADHRDICKFDGTDDPNYSTLRNALAAAVDDLLKDVYVSQAEQIRSSMKVIKKLLGVTGRPDINPAKAPGSCEWINERSDFQDWRDSVFSLETEISSYMPSIYHVTANPGTGKTFLAAYVITSLWEFQIECCYYFFRHGNKDTRSVSGLLRSLAFQIALSSAAIRQALVELYEEDVALDLDDERGIWIKVFKNIILQAPAYTPQYWVIDGLDESSNILDFFTMMKGARPKFPLRIFVTSRKIPEIQRGIRAISNSFTGVEIPVINTMRDLSIYVHARVGDLPIDGDEEKANVANRLLEKSSACFLWVRMVLDELESVYGYESILEILEDMPEGMSRFYERTARYMAENKREKHIARAILTWVVLAPRNISLAELSQALILDINVHLPSIKSAVEGLCGQLVTLDGERVRLTHHTVREFLLSESAGEFRVSQSEGNQQLALTCLRNLTAPELAAPRNPRFANQKRTEATPFTAYATRYFSHHVYGAGADSDELLDAVGRFLQTHATSWIERLAAAGNLSCLIRVARDFRAYLERRAKYLSPLHHQLRNLESWSTDLTRVAAMFGSALLTSPSSIYFLIPPLCPKSSAIHQQMIKTNDGLSLVGYSNQDWDDCIADLSFEGETTSSLACSETFIGVGTEDGKVVLFSPRTFQKEQILDAGTTVDIICFNIAGKTIVAASSKQLFSWDLTGNLTWSIRLRRRCIRLKTSATSIIGVMENGHVISWAVATGDVLDNKYFPYRPVAEEGDGPPMPKAPQVAAISPDLELLALGYRDGTISLWALQNGDFIGHGPNEMQRNPFELYFNPNPNACLLIAGFSDTHLSVYYSWSGTLLSCSPDDDLSQTGLLSLACSPDGRTVASIDIRGTLRIWDFESLELLYHVTTPVAGTRVLKFTNDGTGIVDLMDSSMRVWSPATLIRKTIDEGTSTSDQAVALPVVEGQYETLRNSKISCTEAHPTLPVVFVGRWNGAVEAHSTKTGQLLGRLYTHRGFVTSISAAIDGHVASGDVNGQLLVHRLNFFRSYAEVLVDSRILEDDHAKSIRQLLFLNSSEHMNLLVSTAVSDVLYSIDSQRVIGSHNVEHERSMCYWLAREMPNQAPSELILIDGRALRRYLVANFPQEAGDINITLDYCTPPGVSDLSISNAAFYPPTHQLILDISQQAKHVLQSSVILFNLTSLWDKPGSAAAATISPVYHDLTKDARRLIGLSGPKRSAVLFLDTLSWVSSIDLDAYVTMAALEGYSRHFFVPNAFLRGAGRDRVVAVRTCNDDVVFSVHGQIAVVKCGMKFADKVLIALPGEV